MGPFSIPIGSMYGIFTYIYHTNQLKVGKYTIHGSYGIAMLVYQGVLPGIPETAFVGRWFFMGFSQFSQAMDAPNSCQKRLHAFGCKDAGTCGPCCKTRNFHVAHAFPG